MTIPKYNEIMLPLPPQEKKEAESENLSEEELEKKRIEESKYESN